MSDTEAEVEESAFSLGEAFDLPGQFAHKNSELAFGNVNDSAGEDSERDSAHIFGGNFPHMLGGYDSSFNEGNGQNALLGSGPDEDNGDGTEEKSHESCLDRLKTGCIGILIGLLLFFGSFYVMGWNESRSVHTAETLKECAKRVVEAPCNLTNNKQDFEGKVIHLSCSLEGLPAFSDKDFGVNATTAMLSRHVEMYQWSESSKKTCKKDSLGGGTTCTTEYSYSKDWSSHRIASDAFQGPQRGAHMNPTEWQFSGQEWRAQHLQAGEHHLPSRLADRVFGCSACQERITSGLSTSTVCAPYTSSASPFLSAVSSNTSYGDDYDNYDGNSTTPSSFDPPPPPPSPAAADTTCPWHLQPGGMFESCDGHCGDGRPRVGDLRVEFTRNNARVVSVIAMQTGRTLKPYTSKSGYECFLLSVGEQDATAMLDKALQENTVMAWVLRLVGFIACWAGMYLVLSPLTLVLDLLPFVGPCLADCLSLGIALLTAVAALLLSLVTIAIAWIVVRPVLALTLLAAVLALAATCTCLLRRRRHAAAAANSTHQDIHPNHFPYHAVPDAPQPGMQPPPQPAYHHLYPPPLPPKAQYPNYKQPAAQYPPPPGAQYPPGANLPPHNVYPTPVAQYPPPPGQYPPPPVSGYRQSQFGTGDEVGHDSTYGYGNQPPPPAQQQHQAVFYPHTEDHGQYQPPPGYYPQQGYHRQDDDETPSAPPYYPNNNQEQFRFQ